MFRCGVLGGVVWGLFVRFCPQCSIWGEVQGIVHAEQAVYTAPLSYIPKPLSDVHFGIPNASLIRHTQKDRRARLQMVRPGGSYSLSFGQEVVEV